MRRRAIAICLAATLILSGASSARAYTLQYTDSPNPVQVRWPNRRIKIALSTSLTMPQPNIKQGSDVVGAVRRALARWAGAAGVRFIESSSSVQSVSAPGTRGDGLSLITVAHTAENASPFAGEGSEIPGRTRVFSTVGGSITEADIVLNPAQLFSTDGTIGTYDLEATFTHEIGHLLGLEHSAVLGATMQPRQAKNGLFNLPALSMRTLADDDRAGVRAGYGSRVGVRGAVAGTISFASGAPVFGANIWAEELTTGRVAAGAISLAGGAYRIERLPPGDYRIVAQSLGGTVAAAEIASPRGPYAGLAINQALSFRAEEIGRVSISPDGAAQLNAQLSGTPSLVKPSFIGVNGELSSVAVPLSPGQTYKILLAGEGVKAAQFAAGGVTASSPFLSVDPASVADVDFGPDLSVISFDLTVGGDAEAGDYSLRLQTRTGETAFVAGGLTVETPESLAEAETGEDLLAGAALKESDLDAFGLGNIAVVLLAELDGSDENVAAEADGLGADTTEIAEPERQ